MATTFVVNVCYNVLIYEFLKYSESFESSVIQISI